MLHGVPTSFKKDSVPAAQAPSAAPALLPSCSGATLSPPPGRGAPGSHRAEDGHFTVPSSVWLALCPKRSGGLQGRVRSRGEEFPWKREVQDVSVWDPGTRKPAAGQRKEALPASLFPRSAPTPHVRQRPARGERTILL